MNDEDQNQSRIIPPYVSYITFNSAVASLAEHGVPSVVDKTMFPNFSGGVQRQIMQAFRSLGLTDEDDNSSEKLRELAKTENGQRKEILIGILCDRFPEQMSILKNGTPQQLNNSFDSIGIEQSVKDKCILFFTNAAKDAGLDVSPYILRRKTNRTASKRPAVRGAENQRRKDARVEPDPEKLLPLEAATLAQGGQKIPIALRPGKVWYVQLDEDYSVSDVRKFMKILEMVLLEDAEEDEEADMSNGS